jgi:hypothetical protein
VKTAQDIVNNSGYPLQIRLKEWIEETRQQHKWKVSVSEHRWVNTEINDEGYIDLVLEHKSTNLRLVVECKRITGSWTFLLPMAQLINDRKTRMLSIDYNSFKFLWSEFAILPESPEASFCVMETDGKKDSRTLEKLAGELLLSLEYLAVEETELIRPFIEKSQRKLLPTQMRYLPIIVTTAQLQVMNFNPSSIDVKSGEVIESMITPVKYVRFRKNLATNIKYEKPDELFTLDQLNRENDRTIFVVQTESFINFLSSITYL